MSVRTCEEESSSSQTRTCAETASCDRTGRRRRRPRSSSASGCSPCEEKLVCGEGEIRWQDCRGNLVSRIVSTPSSAAIESSVQRTLDYLVGLYNTSSQITPFQVEHLGLFTDNSTLILSLPDLQVPNVTVGVTQSSVTIAAILSSLKTMQPTSVLSVTYVYRVQSNEMIMATFTLTSSWVDLYNVPQSSTLYITGTMHIVNCGFVVPKFDIANVILRVDLLPQVA